MSYNEFWSDCPQLYYFYEEAYKEKIKQQDILNWQLGAYFNMAINSSFDKNYKYPSSPVFYCEEKKDKTTEEMKEQFEAMVAQINKKFD